MGDIEGFHPIKLDAVKYWKTLHVLVPPCILAGLV